MDNAQLTDAPMSRARLYVLFSAFEADLRDFIDRYIASELGAEATFGSLLAKCEARRKSDRNGGDSLTHYLDLREAYDLINTHRTLVPDGLAREIRQFATSMDALVAIRNRVMHSRPLAAGDGDSAVSHLKILRSPLWKQLLVTLRKLHDDESWEPAIEFAPETSAVLHNLPLSDYDETGLVGREHEVNELCRLIRRRREPVVTIIGEGGIGKTAVAVEVAYRLVDEAQGDFDAILWISFKHERLTEFGVRDISDAVRDLLGAVGPIGSAIDGSFVGGLGELSDLLEGLRVLLILDNLETFSGADFRRMYEELPDTVSYLATSRMGLGEFERRFPLGALSDSDSVALFSDFVRAHRIESLAKLSRVARQQVVRELRCSPLAIKWFSLATVAGRDPRQLIKSQDDLLEFCVRSVYDGLSTAGRLILAALSILSRPVADDELVLLLEMEFDQLVLGVQELSRSALIRRQSMPNQEDLVTRLVLTETATQFLARRIGIDGELFAQVREREREFMADQERRAADRAARSLAPIVIRTRSVSDSPTASILRQAMIEFRRVQRGGGEIVFVYDKLALARRMNPDYWEVDRVEGFIRAGTNELSAATACYERAYRLADDGDRGIVAHFYAGHLARNMRHLEKAIEYARVANDSLGLPETEMALGNYLVWAQNFDEGLPLLSDAAVQSDGKANLIAVSALAEGIRRWAEFAGEHEKNYLLQFERAVEAFEVSTGKLVIGTIDARLLSTAGDAASLAIRASARCVADGVDVGSLKPFLERLKPFVVRILDPQIKQRLGQELRRLEHESDPGAEFLSDVEELILAVGDRDREAPSEGLECLGEIVQLRPTFGFVSHPQYPDNLFFHKGLLVDVDAFDDLRVGDVVSFVVGESDRGLQARDLQPVSSRHLH